MNSSFDREVAVFNAARGLPVGERPFYLAGACAGDAGLRLRVEELLKANDAAGTFLHEKPSEALVGKANLSVGAATIRVALPPSEKPGDRVGRYKLLQQIGEGGCGVVYMAEQEEPVVRRVAVKVIKLGMDTKQVVARFEAERQALAMMDHPNIAKVLDAGATENGRPYFVMELVRGVKLTEYCDQNHLKTEQRLELFLEVCKAIQHAHQKGIIHRDIKPSNILVTLHDGVPVPKVIDFGIAKATQGRLTDQTLFTAFEQFIGTPAYMSPEQAEMSGLDIDTRSDIYSLGVLLYELMTGKTPFDGKKLLAAGLDELRRTIREQEPVRPSTRLSTMVAADLNSAARQRQAEPAKLASLIRGDLDWIVMKALEKDRTRRYETANGLAMDISRHLNNEPVVARPASGAYRIGKLVRRNRVAFIAGGLVVMALVVGVAVSTWQAIRATRAERMQIGLRQRAVANEKKALLAQAATEQEKRATEQARQSEVRQRQQAEEQRKHAQAAAYDSDVNLAQQALAQNNLAAAWALLDHHRPQPGQEDLRGWEWRYLWQQCQSEALSKPCQLSNYIQSLAVSSDGKWLMAGGILLDVSDPKSPRTADPLNADNCAFSPREPLLALSSRNDPDRKNTSSQVFPNDRFKVQLWNPETKQTVAEFQLEGKCRGLAFSHDGQTLLTWEEVLNGESRLALWRVPDLERLADYPSVPTPDGGWREFAATRDLTVVALCVGRPGEPGRLRVIDLATGKERWTIPMGVISCLAFSPDGKLLLSAEGFTTAPVVRVWDAVSGKEIGPGLTAHHEWISALVFWPDGKTLATASADQTIRLWDLADLIHPRPLGRPLLGHKGEVWALALLPDNQTLISCAKGGSMLAWDTRQARIDRAHFILDVPELETKRVAPDSKSIFTVDSHGQVVEWRGPDFQIRDVLLEIGSNFSSACLSEDCRLLASGSTNGIIQLWDVQKRTRWREFRAGAGTARPDWFLDKGGKLIVETDGMVIHEWDLATLRETASWQDIEGRSLLSKDERWYFTLGFSDGRLLARDMATGLTSVQTNRSLEISEVAGVAASPDGKLFAAASVQGFVRLFDRATLREMDTLRGFLLEAAFSVCFSPDGKRLATGSGGREAIRLWDLDQRQQLLILEGDWSGNWFNTRFSPDGNLIVSEGWNALHVWRAPSWERIAAAEKAQAKAE